MDPESIMAADGTDSAPANGGLAMENVCVKENGAVSVETVDTTSESQNENSANSSTLDTIEHVKEAAEGTQVEHVDDSKCMKGEKAQRKPRHEKLSDSEETQTPRLGRLSLDERASKDNPTAKGIMPTVDLKKQPVRKSLPRLPSQKTVLPDGKPAPAKAAIIPAKVRPEKKKLEKDAETVNQTSHPTEEEAQVTVSSNADVEDSHETVSPRMNEDRADKSIEVSEAVAVEH